MSTAPTMTPWRRYVHLCSERLFLKGKTLRMQPEARRKEISSGERAQCFVNLRTMGGHPCSEGSFEPAEFRWTSPASAKGLLSSPRSRSCHLALDALRLTFLLQSQLFSRALGETGSCFPSLRHHLIFWRLRWNQRHWGE